jgi:hypothetical protein
MIGKVIQETISDSRSSSGCSLIESKNALSTFWVRHTMDADGGADRYVIHVLGRDEDILLLVRCVRSIDLCREIHASVRRLVRNGIA